MRYEPIMRTLLLCFFGVFIFIHSASAQCTINATVDLTGQPAGSYTSASIVRSGNCCSATSNDCVTFEVTLDPASIGLVFEIASGAIPPGSLFYQINCGTQAPVGSDICLQGGQTYTVTFCKPGNNQNTYRITSISDLTVPAITAKAGCTTPLSADIHENSGSVVWSGVNPSTNAWLSCLSCTDPVFSAPLTASSPITYNVTWTATGFTCNTQITSTKQAVVTVIPPPTVALSPTSLDFCAGTFPTITATASGPGNYAATWYSGANATGSILGTGFTLNPPQTVGTFTYSVKVVDLDSPCNYTIQNFPVTVKPAPSLTLPNLTLCAGDERLITLNSADVYTWSPTTGVTNYGSGVFGILAGSNQTYQVTATNNFACSTTRTFQTTVQPCMDCPSVPTQCSLLFFPKYTKVSQFEAAGGIVNFPCSVPDNNIQLLSETMVGSGCPGNGTRIYKITDSCGNEDTCVLNFLVNDSTFPYFETAAPTFSPITCTQALPVQPDLKAKDNCTVIATKSIDPFVVNVCSGYTVTYRWKAKDGCGNEVNASSTLQVLPDTEPPVFKSFPTDTAVSCSQIPAIQTPVIQDSCDAAPTLTYTLAETPGTCPQEKIMRYTWTARDQCGNQVQQTQTITVFDNIPPVLSNVPANATVSCSSIPAPQTPTVTDNCAAPANITIQYTQTQTAGSCPHSYTLTRTWTATDPCGNSSSASQVLTVQDLTAPVLSAFPANITVSCDNIPTQTVLTATDNCDPAPSVTPTETRTNGSCPWSYTLTRTWVAMDACGNTSNHTQTVTVQDLTAPIFTSFPANESVSCSAIPAPATPTFTDNCDPTPRIIFGETIQAGTCPGAYMLNRTWTIRDTCGNSSAQTQQILVFDTTPPVLSAQPANSTVACDNIPAPPTLTATDNCDANPTVTFSETIANTCASSYLITRTWTATDHCFNTITHTQVITVQDNALPQFVNPPNDITVSCSNVPSAPTLTATDNCTASPVISFVESRADGSCPYNYTLTRTWTATDLCGNQAVHVQKVTVQDIISPTLIGVPADTSVSCQTIPVPATPTATDNCDPSPVIELQTDTLQKTCPGTYQLRRTWTARDICGNTTIKVQLITVSDTEAPQFSANPANTTTSCDAVPAPQVITIVDNCDATPTLTFTQDSIPGSCPGNYQLTRTWTARDTCGNTATISQTITVEDNTPPVWTSTLPANQTVSCDAIPSAATVTATDNCGSPPAITPTETKTNGSCAGTYTLTRTWTATDACTNLITHTQVITVQDNTAPVFNTFPDNTTVTCDAIPTPATPTFTDTCDPNPSISLVQDSIPGTCPGNYRITRTWTIRDDCGNTHSRTQEIQVTDLIAPVLSSLPPDITADCSNIPAAPTIAATDNCDPNPTVTFNQTSGTSCATSYSITRVWTATDHCGNTTTHTQVITVQDNTPPQFINPPADVTAACDAVPTAPTLTATDDCTPNPVINYIESRTDGSCPSNYTLIRTWTATDLCGNIATHIQQVTIEDKIAPVLSNTPSDVTVSCASIPAIATPTATDACDPSPVITFQSDTINQVCPGEYQLRRTWTARDQCGNESTHTQLITISDTDAPQISADPDDISVSCEAIPVPPVLIALDLCDPSPALIFTQDSIPGSCPGSYQLVRRWTATDWCGNTTSVTQLILVQDQIPPVWVNFPPDQSVDCASIPPAPPVTANDNCDPAPSVIFSEAPATTCSNGAYTIIRTWTATDVCGNTTTNSQTLTVVDSIPPVITNAPPSATVDCSNIPPAANPGVTDNCDPAPSLTFSETKQDSCATGYAITRTWTATDACGNISIHVQVLTLEDTQPPVWQNAPADLTVACDQVPTAANLTVTDNCDPAPSTNYKETRTDGSCPYTYTLTRVWSAIDNCGNIGTHTQVIEVQDITPPTIAGIPTDITVPCESVPAAATPTATDNCDPSPKISFTETTTPGSCPGAYTIVRSWVVTDTCGNTASGMQTIQVIDNLPPVITGVPADITVSCDAIPAPVTPAATDNCDPAPTITLNTNIQPGACPGTYILERTWLAVDHCNNTSFQTQRITVQDNTPPVFNTLPANETVACDAIPVIPTLTATDNCDLNPEITFSETNSGSCAGSYTLTRIWTATDACNNTTIHTQLITVVDSLPPILSSMPADLLISCATIPPAPVVTATDNCTPAPVVQFLETQEPQNCPGNYLIKRSWTATDSCGNTVTHVQTIQVKDTIAPILTQVPADVSVACGNIPAPGSPTATDNCDLSPTVTLSEKIIAGTCSQTYTIERTWTAKDACGNMATAMQLIQVSDQLPPVLSGVPASIAVSCDAIPAPATVTLTDNCDLTPVLTFSEDTTGISCPARFTLVRTWIGKDACGNMVTATQQITVRDSIPPMITGIPANATVSCAAIPALPTLQATDNCDPNPFLKIDELFSAGSCIGTGTLTRTWTATDACSNTFTATQILTIQDTEAPAFNNPPGNVLVSCKDIPNTTPLTATDNCDPNPVVTFQEVKSPDCKGVYTITRTWTAKDQCNNTRTHQQIITVEDKEAPALFGIPEDQNLTCGETPNVANPTVLDNCDANPSLLYTQDSIPGSCASNYTLIRKWRVTDQCGNTQEKRQTIVYKDVQAPTWANIPTDVSIACSDPLPIANPTASDNCTFPVTLVKTDSFPTPSCPNTYLHIRIWRATDQCGNSSVIQQKIEIKDNTAPVLIGLPIDVTTSCNAVPTAPTITATDNCDLAPKVVYAEAKIPGTCANSYTLRRTWTATDACQNKTSFTQVIKVEDNQPPVLAPPPADVVVHCKEAIPPMVKLNWTDNCGGSGSVSGTDISNGGNPEIITRTWTVTDSCNFSTSVSQKIRIEPLQGTVTNDGPVCENETIHLNASGGNTYSWKGPGGFSANGPTVSIKNTTPAQSGTYTVTIRDAQGCTQALPTTVVIKAHVIQPLSVQLCKGETYTINGQTFSTAGNYTVKFPGGATNGCDSIVQLQLTIVDASIHEIEATICPAGSYTLNGKTYKLEGTYVETLPGAAKGGCDSVIILKLQVRDQITEQLNIKICQGETYTLNGKVYTTSGTFTQTLTGAAQGGCDSLVELRLTVHPVPEKTIVASICQGSSYTVGGTAYQQSGSYKIVLENASVFGCDSIIFFTLTALEHSLHTIQATICEGTFYTLNGSNYNTSGVITQRLEGKAQNGCDSIIQLTLTVLPKATGSLTASICEGSVFTANGETFQATGTYVQTLKNQAANGCDSVLTIQLTVFQPTTETIQQTICNGETFTVNGTVYDASGTYTQQLTNKNGCDSTLIIQLTELEEIHVQQNATLCLGTFYTFDGKQLTQSGTYTQFLPGGSSTGCDSTTVLELSPGLPSTKDTSVTLCAGGVFYIGPFDFSTSGTYTRTLNYSNAQNCDSTVNLKLTILPEISSTTKATICAGGSYRFFGRTYSEQGIYSIPLRQASRNGCDSILYLDLTVQQPAIYTYTAEICQGSSYSFFEKTLTQSGTYRKIFAGAAQSSCDSIVELQLRVLTPPTDTIRARLCRGAEYILAGKTYSKPGTYQISLPPDSVNICGSTSILLVESLPDIVNKIQHWICPGDTLRINGVEYTQAGVYRDTLSNAASNGCDSIIERTLNVYPEARGRITATICPEKPVELNGELFSVPGTYTRILKGQAATGCDSILLLTLLASKSDTASVRVTLCNREEYVFAGKTFRDTGTFLVVLPTKNQSGCDSLVWFTLRKASSDTTHTNTTICAGDTLTFGTNIITEAGSYSTLYQSTSGCDSLSILHVSVATSSVGTLDTTICLGQKLRGWGKTFTTTGRYEIMLQNAAGCDSLLLLNLHVEPTDTFRLRATVCSGSIYTLNNQKFFNAGTYVQRLPGATKNGCDSLILLELNMADRVEGEMRAGICPAGFVTVNGLSYNKPGTYTQLMPKGAQTGCDSLLRIILTDIPESKGTLQTTLCKGDTLRIHGKAYTTPGAFTQTLIGAASTRCDSILTVQIQEILPATGRLRLPLCSGDSVVVAGKVFHKPGTYPILFDNGASNGCDSTLFLELYSIAPGTSSIEASICMGNTYRLDTASYEKPGTYTYILPGRAQNGCDSIITLKLSTFALPEKRLFDTLCFGETLIFKDSLLTRSGQYRFTLPKATSNGCDSTVVLSLHVRPLPTATIRFSLCAGDTIQYQGKVYTQPGIFEIRYPNAAKSGCDSVLNLQIEAIPSADTTIQRAICIGKTVRLNGRTYSKTGTYLQTLPGAARFGCDSLITLRLEVLDTSRQILEQALCPGDSLVINGSTYYKPGMYIQDFPEQATTGCDSQLIIRITPLLPPHTFADQTICEGDSVTLGNAVYSTAGRYTYTFPSGAANGCDSIVTLTLRVLPNAVSQIDTVLFENDTLTLNGITYTQQGTYQQNFPGKAANGCDSTLVIQLRFNGTACQDTLFQKLELCYGDTQTIAMADFFPRAFSGQLWTLIYPPTATGILFDHTKGILQHAGAYPGTYTLTWNPGTLTPCPRTWLIAEITVHPAPLANAGPDQSITCADPQVTLSGTSCTTCTTQWRALDGNTSTVGSRFTTGKAGAYVLSVLDTVIRCSNADTALVQLDTLPPIADAGADAILSCTDTQYIPDATRSSIGSIYRYTWTTLRGEAPRNTDILTPALRTPGVYRLQVRNTRNGCTSSDTLEILPDPDALTAVTLQVTGPNCDYTRLGEIAIQAVSGGIPPFSYRLDAGPQQTIATFYDLRAGTYTVHIQDVAGCSFDTLVSILPPNDDITLDLGPDLHIFLGDTVDLIPKFNFSPDSLLTLTWTTPKDYFACDTCRTQHFVPLKTAQYRAIAENLSGCKTSDQVVIYVDERGRIYVPSAFSPNGDGVNDIFRLYGDAAVQEVELLQVYDRWGTLLYTAHMYAPNDPLVGWDGTYKGQMLDPAVFVFYARVRLINGDTKLLKGGITLMR